MPVNAINGVSLSSLSTVNGRTLSTLSAIDGQSLTLSAAIIPTLIDRFYWPGRTQEPGDVLVINQASLLTTGLVFLAYPGGARWNDLVSGGKASPNQVFQWFQTGSGLRYGYGKGATSTDVASYPWGEAIATITDQCTMLAWLSVSSLSSAFAGLISIPYANGTWVSPFVAIDFSRNGSTSSLNFGYTQSGTNVSVTSDTGLIAADNVLRLYAVTRSGATVTFYKDGLQHGTQKTLGTNAATDWGAKQPVTIGNRSSSSTGNSMGGTFTNVAIWNRCLGATEIFELFQKPLILVKPIL